MKTESKIVGIDLFAGAGGLTQGAKMVGIDVRFAVENDIFAAKTFQLNHPEVKMINQDIQSVDGVSLKTDNADLMILFGGPPCQGYSTSNQKTRNIDNPKNWLFQEFVRIARELEPDWIVLENVKGLIETGKGFFEETIRSEFEKLGYTCTECIPSAADYGVPQRRNRFFLIGSRRGLKHVLPKIKSELITVREAFSDLPSLENGASTDMLPYKKEAESGYAIMLRSDLKACTGHLVSHNAPFVTKRYPFIPQGGNWSNIPDELMENYKDKSRCHTGIYKRLKEDEPAMTVGNYRKSMIIHPWEDRGLSVREAARLQSFPDSYVFFGSIGYQQQQVGNAVPPLLAKAVFEGILNAEKASSQI